MNRYRIVKNQGEYKVQEFRAGCSISGAPHRFDEWTYLLDNKYYTIKGKTLEKAEIALKKELEYRRRHEAYLKEAFKIEVIKEIEL